MERRTDRGAGWFDNIGVLGAAIGRLLGRLADFLDEKDDAAKVR